VNAVELINKKKERRALTEEEISFLVESYTAGEIPDYQFAAFLMAVRLNGMTLRETGALTGAMIDSGDSLDLRFLGGPKVDKHSTGGVGDKISLILAPLVACFDIAVPMISGRGLGHTGGTLDKLESIPGFRTNLSIKEMYRALKRVGCFISGQTPEIAPADRRIYALRDVTGTVDSIPLITASIMSKKLAEGIDGLVVDVKCGEGAFIKRRRDAVILARWMRKVGEKMGKVIVTVLTSMDQPIGRMVGNGLEVWETVRALKGRCEPDVLELVLTLGSRMLMIAGRADNLQQARDKLQSMLESGKAWDKFRKMVCFQGGDVAVLQKKNAFVKAKYQYEVRAVQTGYVSAIDALGMGVVGIDLGVGRKRVVDKVDHDSGLEVLKKVGQAVDRKEGLVVVHSNKPLDGFFLDRARRLFRISKTPVKPPRLILS